MPHFDQAQLRKNTGRSFMQLRISLRDYCECSVSDQFAANAGLPSSAA
jgi:hypothetical protein